VRVNFPRAMVVAFAVAVAVAVSTHLHSLVLCVRMYCAGNNCEKLHRNRN